jgi:hypothetical protein
MKDKNLHNGIDEIHQITMTVLEKKRIFENITNSTVTSNRPVRSTWFSYSFLLSIHKNQLAYYIIIPLITILASSGVVFASQDSLPDSIFYPIKVNIVEPVVGILTFSQEGKAQHESNLATERMVEAEKLASQGKLDTVKEKKLNDLLVKHTNALNNALANINQDNSSDQTDEIVTNFNARMNAHARVLDIISNQESKPNSKVFDNQISKNARFSANVIKDNSESKDKNVSSKYKARKKVVDSLITSAATNINNTAVSATNTDQTIISDTNQTINDAKQYLDEAVNKENKGDSREAYKALLDSESAVKEADIFLKTRLELKHKDD